METARSCEGAEGFKAVRQACYRLEPYIPRFADFDAAHDQDVLEIGVGMGSDHRRLALAKPRTLTGIDLTTRAVEFTRQQLALEDLQSDLREADAENLPFDDASFVSPRPFSRIRRPHIKRRYPSGFR